MPPVHLPSTASPARVISTPIQQSKYGSTNLSTMVQECQIPSNGGNGNAERTTPTFPFGVPSPAVQGPKSLFLFKMWRQRKYDFRKMINLPLIKERKGA